MNSISEKSLLGKKIAEKRKLLRDLYGGIMTPSQLDRELGRSKGAGTAWARMVGLEAIPLSPRRKGYETDLVAEAMVRGRSAV